MTYWKFLRPGGIGPFSTVRWPAPASWLSVEDVVPCSSGIHACRAADLPYWLAEELWVVELEDPEPLGHKVVSRRGRLVERVAAWGPELGEALAFACVGRTAEHAVAQLRADGLADVGERLADAAAGLDAAGARRELREVAAESGGAAARADKLWATRLCGYVGDAVDYLAGCPPATIAYIAARAADERTDLPASSSPSVDERAWQADWIVERAGLG